MNFVFESLESLENFVSCHDRNESGIKRFTSSPIVETMVRLEKNKKKFTNGSIDHICIGSDPNAVDNYIIASGVTHSPWDWCGAVPTGNNVYNGGEKKNLFSFLNEIYLNDLRSGKALLLLDQCHEGYHAPWMFNWFHASCEYYGINPSQIIYVTGNLHERSQYQHWLETHAVSSHLCIIPHAHFESMIYDTAINRVRIHQQPALPSFNDQIEYKRKNLTKIKTYNALQKRPRAHRAWLFKELVCSNLLDHGINSMNDFDHSHSYYINKFMSVEDYSLIKRYLPMMPPDDQELDKFQADDSGKYQTMFNEQIMLDTWLTVVSEASFGEDTCFISEKTFKPIAAHHPFIVYGNRHSLHYLRDLGYKTFSPYINEDYDGLDTWERLAAIIASLKEFNSLTNEDKIKSFVSMKEILEHNYQTLQKNSQNLMPQSMIDIINYSKQ